MKASAFLGAGWEDDSLDVLWEDADRAFCKLDDAAGSRHVFIPTPAHSGVDYQTIESVSRLAHEFDLKDYLDNAWALCPLALVRERGRTMLVVEYGGGVPLNHLTDEPMEVGQFLRLAIAMTAALGRVHGCGLIHKDIKPANVLVDAVTEQVRLTGFGMASRLPRERQSPDPPEFIAGSLAYMAPEQTGRVNRSIDSRSDLYSLGVTFYEMLMGGLPFTAADPMEWVHCHVARQPVAPSQRLHSVPVAVSAITMKLLSKTAEERYQTAGGVESDLRRCLSQLETHGRIQDFVPGAHDTSNRLIIPERLYGRDRELNTLLSAFDRVVAGGRPEMVLVSGYSGVGKSAVVHELDKQLVPPRGLFVSGKFDQYKRDIPYATLAQAFQSLVRPLLSKNEEELARWRESLSEALAPNGMLLVNLVPELKHVIGEQPPVPELPPQEAQRRFQLAFRRFIGVFARPEHPLAIFLDDLQWLDPATLDLLEDLLSSNELQHLLLIGAYRNNEVGPTHPLALKIDAIRQGGAALQDIVLTPLSPDDLNQLLGDSLHCEPRNAAPLAELVHEKTTGNPFFAIQFIAELADEGLLSFEADVGRWVWNLPGIHAKGFTDNVVDLMLGKLSRLPVHTQAALQVFACMGNSAAVSMLQMGYQGSADAMNKNLWEAVRSGLIFRANDSYRFLHDRVQEAAYSLIPESQRAASHLRIGMLLAEQVPEEKREEVIFEIVNQLNRGSHLITSVEERDRVASLNLLAGRRAKASTAYESALKYLRAGLALLTEETWQRNYDLIFAIEYVIAECELLTADKIAAESRILKLVQRAGNRHDFCTATRLCVTLYMTLDRSDLCIDVFLDWLRREGTVWAKHPSRDEVMLEFSRIWSLLGDREIEDLIDLPLITDRDLLDTLDVFTEIMTPSQVFDDNLSSLVMCRMVTFSLEHGNSDAACFAYVWFAMFGGPRFDRYREGFQFGQLGFDLVQKRGLVRYQARIWMNMGSTVLPWAQHPATGRDLVRRAFDAAYRAGDLTFASYSWTELVTVLLAAGDPLHGVQSDCEKGVAFSKRMRFGLIVELCEQQLGLVLTLRGLTPCFGSLDHEGFSEANSERRFANSPNLAFAAYWHWTRKLQARFFAGDIPAAVECSLQADQYIWTSAAMFEGAEHRLYGALAHAAAWDTASPDKRLEHAALMTSYHDQLQIWAMHNPATFENRAALVGAEIARIEQRVLDAQELYERAIRSARANEFVQNEALANEVAARFYSQRGFERIATTYLADARNCYLRWGADGKVKQLDQLYPDLRPSQSLISEPTTTIYAPVDQLDLATVIKVSESVSGEIVLEKLIDTLMRTAIEHAGAERGLLILLRENDYRIEADVTTRGDHVDVELRHATLTAKDLPESVFNYALRTKESVLLHDAYGSSQFSADDYIRTHYSRSLLCLPILKQGRLLGMLYLENNLATQVFTPERMAILKLLASEAASSIENARLYRDLAKRESRIRRLVDANIIGIVIWDFEGRILDANDAYLKMVGYEREDLLSGRLRWKDLTPPEWLDHEERHLLPQLKATGSLAPFEKEYFRKDGSRVPVLLGLATFEEDDNQGVAFAIDLTERKGASDALRALQMELAHANRLSTMGQLTASIAHEVNQPIGAARNNAHAALRFLTADPPNLAEVSEALECVVSDTYRAGEIIHGIRDQVKKTSHSKGYFDLNKAIEDVVALVRGELSRIRASLQMELGQLLPSVHGDRVQLQQVMLNLILNAIEAMNGVDDEERALIIRTESSFPGELQVSVCDSGPGVAPEDRERIFDSFYTTKDSGVGIGLSICRSIIEGHGGRLWADANCDRGTVLRFTLPAHN